MSFPNQNYCTRNMCVRERSLSVSFQRPYKMYYFKVDDITATVIMQIEAKILRG